MFRAAVFAGLLVGIVDGARAALLGHARPRAARLVILTAGCDVLAAAAGAGVLALLLGMAGWGRKTKAWTSHPLPVGQSRVAGYNNDDENLSLILSIAASIFTSIFGALCYDRYKEISGNTVLVKKGQGAVRSLYIIVEKIKNISLRISKSKNIEEAENLLSLVEKDVSNSIKEWTDVLPNIVTSYPYTSFIIDNIQTEESNLNDEINRNNELQKQLNDTIEKLSTSRRRKNKKCGNNKQLPYTKRKIRNFYQ